MNKRILIFSTAYLPLVGGAEIAVKEITDRLSEYEFVMLTAKIKPELAVVERVGQVEVHRIGKGNHWDKFRLIWSGWKEARELSPPAGGFDAVWSIMASYSGFAALRYKKRNPSIPFLLNLQEGDSKAHVYKHVWWCWPYFKQIFQKSNHIHVLSTYLANWAKEMGATCPIEVVPNGVDVERFKIKDSRLKIDSRNEIKDQLKIPEQAKLVITVSRLVKKNGVDSLVRAMMFLPGYTHLLIAGIGELETILKQVTVELGLSERVHFLGNISQERLPEYLWASDVFCRPSLSEGLGISFLEAMAAGVPMVATRVGGIPDFLKDGETGLFCKVGDPKDIADKIYCILNDPTLAERLRVNGRELVAEHYNWDSIARRMDAIFLHL